MALPKYVLLRGETYYVRRPLPLDVQGAFGGKKEVWRSLGTTTRREAEARSHGVLADIEADIQGKRTEQRASDDERAFLASDRSRAALREFQRVASQLPEGPLPYVEDAADDTEWTKLAVMSGQCQLPPASRAAAIASMDDALADLDQEAAQAHLRAVLDHEGDPDFGFPLRYRASLEDRLRELIEADRRTIGAQRAILAGTTEAVGSNVDEAPGRTSLKDLSALWITHRKPAASSQADMRTAIARFERVNGPLPYPQITDEHVRRFKADLLAEPTIKNATRRKLWGMLQALLGVAVDDALLASNPFARVKLKLDDDSARREMLTAEDLKSFFAVLDGEEWWITRIGLYTGARLNEICQLTKADFQASAGATFVRIREDAENRKTVKTRSSIRTVPLHRQLIADGVLDWVSGRDGDRLFSVDGPAASKRLLRRMRQAKLGDGKVFHSLRHTFKGVARRHMDSEWHDRLTGHAAKNVGQGYGDYELTTLKAKLDAMEFGVETTPAPTVPAVTGAASR